MSAIADRDVKDPAMGQTERAIGEYLRSCSVGSPVAIHNTHGGMLIITLTTVTEVRERTLRTDAEGQWGSSVWYLRTGRSFKYPNGQAHLVAPTDEVRTFAERHGRFGVMSYRTARLYGTD